MAAGLGFKTFNTGDVLSAADVNGYLMQGVLVFADAAARTAAITSPQEGQVSFLKDTNSTEYYSGSAWVAIGGSVPTSLEFAAGKNKIINGDFGINQRNFTSNTTNGLFNFDRFSQVQSGGTVTVTPQVFTPGTAPVSGYEAKNYLRMVTASQSASTDYLCVQQKIESVRTFAGQTATFSLWAKASTGTPKIGLNLEQNFGSGGSATVVTGAATTTITSSWARYTFVLSVPSISGKTVGTSDFLNVMFFTSCGTSVSASGYPAVGVQNVTIDIWGLQMEAGSTATSFQTATGTIQGELAACQRYYYRQDSSTAIYTRFGMGVAVSTTVCRNIINLPVTMRTAPSSIDFSTITLDGFGTGLTAITNLAFDASAPTIVTVDATVASGLTTYKTYAITANGSSSAYVGYSAEL